MRKNSVRIITIIFLCFMPVWMLVSRDVDFSDKENRYMAKFPKITVKALADGSFMEDFETYLTDQFPVRDACITLKTNTLRLLGQRRINGVYICDKGYLIAEEEKYSPAALEDLTQAVNGFADASGADVKFMLVPNASLIYEERLPYGVKSTENDTVELVKSRLSDSVGFVDVRDALLAQKGIQLYYKTDHHWTTAAAYAAFEEYAREAGLDISSVQYESYCVSGAFQGTQASNCGVYSSSDAVNICVPKDSEGSYIVNYADETRKSATLFDMSRLEEKDKYLVFMGGNYSRVDISTRTKNGRRLLLIKDSYANCFIPMLTPCYEEIIVIDPRYYYDDIYQLMSDNMISDVLFLYNVNSFVSDNSLEEVLKKVLHS
ncbi:MAG: DHHW family protein [Butyrivibrio sp.]|nr:DHHW family protein [Butyrivibrio sp.]